MCRTTILLCNCCGEETTTKFCSPDSEGNCTFTGAALKVLYKHQVCYNCKPAKTTRAVEAPGSSYGRRIEGRRQHPPQARLAARPTNVLIPKAKGLIPHILSPADTGPAPAVVAVVPPITAEPARHVTRDISTRLITAVVLATTAKNDADAAIARSHVAIKAAEDADARARLAIATARSTIDTAVAAIASVVDLITLGKSHL